MQLIKHRLLAMCDRREAFELIKVFESLFNTQCLGQAGLAINAAASPSVKASVAFSALANGVLVYQPAATLMAALGGATLATLQYQMWIFTIDGAGVLRTYAGVPALTLAGVQIPTVPEVPQQAMIGSLVLYNGTAAPFIPGTTALDVALLVPVYNNTTGPFYPVQIL